MKLLTITACTTALLASPAYPAIIGGPVFYNDHIYYLLSGNTWTNAEAEALTLGGHLVTINDAAENTFVYNTFNSLGGVPRALWLGLRQPPGSPEPAAGFTWVDGSPVTYTNWVTGEPNNNSANGAQNWAMIWPAGANVSPNSPSKWNDYWNFSSTTDTTPNYALAGVVEIVPEPSAALLAGIGVAGLAFSCRRPRRVCHKRPAIFES